MPQPKLPSRPPIIIDLTSDNESVPQIPRTVDLTVLDEYDISSNVSLESKVDVDTRTLSLTSSHDQTQGFVISPNTQHDTNDSTSDDEMTLGGILTRCRKRKHGAGSTAVPKFEPDNTSLSLTKKALQSFPEVQSLKPDIDFWTIHQTMTTQPGLSRRQPEHKPKDKGNGGTSSLGERSNHLFLNIDRNEIFGREDHEANENHTPTQHSKPNRNEPAKSASADTYCSLGFSARTIELAKKSTINADTEEHRAHKRTRLEEPEGAATNGVPRTCANDHTNPGTLEAGNTTEDCGHSNNTQIGVAGRDITTPDAIAKNTRANEILETSGVSNHADNSNITSRAKPLSSAFDDAVSSTNLSARRRTGGPAPIPASQPNITQGISRPSFSSVGRRRKPRENTQLFPSFSCQQLRHRSLSPVTTSQRQRKPVTPPDSQSDGIKRLHKRPLADDAKRISSRRKKIARQKQHNNKDSQELAEDALAQQRGDDLFGSDTSSHASCAIPDVQRLLADHDRSQRGSREPTSVGGYRAHQVSDGHIRQQKQLLPQPKPQPKPSTIKLLTKPARPEPKRPYATRNETFEDAAASFNLLQSQHEKKRTTTILDSVPADFGMPSRASRTQAVYRANHFGRRRRRYNARSAEIKRARYRERAIEDKRKKLEEEFADEPESYRETLVNERLDEYRQKFVENDRRRKGQAQNFLTVDFIEDGAGVDEADNDNISAGNGGALPVRPMGAIPASQAMGPKDTMVLYAVYVSEPFDEGEDYEKYMQRTAEAFLKKEEANAFAQKLLTDTSSSSRQPRQDATSVWYATDSRGLLFGRKSLPNGKVICCMVEKEKQVFGLLDMSNKWVKEEVKDLYRPRFDVFITDIIPNVFLDKEEEAEKKRKEQKAKEAAAEAEKQPEEGEVQAEENGHEERPWVWKLDEGEGEDDGKSDHDSLFSPTPPPGPEATQEADECPPQGNNNSIDDGDNDSDDNDTASIASDATLRPSHPGGALGKLSYSDVEYCTIHAGSYTDLRLANEEAFKVALLYWRPRNARMEAWQHYNYAIVPSIEEDRGMDLDADRVNIGFEVPDINGLVEHRPWPFVNSRVFVAEVKLEGPRDIACDFVLADGEDE